MNHIARWFLLILGVALLLASLTFMVVRYFSGEPNNALPRKQRAWEYQPRAPLGLDSSGLYTVFPYIQPWQPDAPLDVVAQSWQRVGYRGIEYINEQLTHPRLSEQGKANYLVLRAILYNYEGEPERAYQSLTQARELIEAHDELAEELLYSTIFYQGVTALRRGETDNCILCRGESSCILPLAPEAIHTNPTGSRLAIQHFTEYLEQFPDDLAVRWLLNVAHMTLGEHPQQVDPNYRISLDRFEHSEFSIGQFRDIGHLVGVNRFSQSGGAIMEDFDNDGLLDIVVTSYDPTQPMAYYRNTGEGVFEERTEAAGLSDQLGGLYCVQTDFNNDGYRDIFVPRGAWIEHPIRPSLLKNRGDGTFEDVTEEAGLLDPVNSISATWAYYDNDGWLDLFICCEWQSNRLYHNEGDGTFREVAHHAGIEAPDSICKGATWVDYDNDDYPDLFVNLYKTRNSHSGLLFHNNRDGTFTDVTTLMGIKPVVQGFSCWAWDYNNDGWQDLFATSFSYHLEDAVKGLLGTPHNRHSSKLYRNRGGKGFEDVTEQAGLDMVFMTMGSNYGDFDNDGFLDMYLGTGAPNIEILVPNRMFKNVVGQRFADITASSRTGNLQKGHGVAAGDWDRDGDVDIFIQMGGAINGDQYHDILFQNPGQGHNWLTVKLTGVKTNRAAIGTRIKVVTAGGEEPLTVHRHVSSGSSFGANPLQQTIGLADAERIDRLEIHWPTSGTTQVFHDLEVNQAIQVTEFAPDYQRLEWIPLPAPK